MMIPAYQAEGLIILFLLLSEIVRDAAVDAFDIPHWNRIM